MVDAREPVIRAGGRIANDHRFASHDHRTRRAHAPLT